MNYEEFKARTTEAVSYETFEKFEKMYMAGDVDKDIFCHLMRPLVLAMTKAVPYEEAKKNNHADYHDAITKAHVFMEECRVDDFVAEMEAATLAGRDYIANKKAVDSIFAELK